VPSKKRTNALASLAADMKMLDQPVETTKPKQATPKPKQEIKTKRGGVSNIPWYPKSAKLKKELKLLALHEDSSLTALIDEGIRLVLKKRGKNMDDYI